MVCQPSSELPYLMIVFWLTFIYIDSYCDNHNNELHTRFCIIAQP